MNYINHLITRLDKFQQRHAVLAVPIAVFKKYSDDHGNHHVAVLTYYAFLSLFPLLLLLLTALELFMATYPEFREAVIRSTLENFPALSEALDSNVQALSGTWFRILFTGIIAILASFGVANTIRNTVSELWQIPLVNRRTAPWSLLANLGLILIGGLILVATTLIAGWLAQANTAGYYILTTAINFGLFLLGYRIATSRQIKTKNLIVQASMTTVAWQILQVIGGLLVQHQLNRLDALYGSFAIILGLLFWLYLIARVAVYSIEVDVVLTRRFWPRGLTEELTSADKRFYIADAKARKRHRKERVAASFIHNRK